MIRETLNKHKSAALIGAGAVCIVASLLAFTQLRGSASTAPTDKAFFTTDDGQTLFTDDIARLAPFDHDGRPAYRAHVFECDGKQVVGYLMRYNDAARKALESARSAAPAAGGRPGNGGQVAAVVRAGTELKKPGTKDWIPLARASHLTVVKCPNGKVATAVEPQ